MFIFGGQLVKTNEAVDKSPFGDAQTVEEFVREYFEDIPVMIDIARCESTFRHVGTNGSIIRGEVNRSDVGVMQINEYYHADTAQKLDIDLYTLEGNVKYARSLYEREGTVPWGASESCWENQHLVLAN